MLHTVSHVELSPLALPEIAHSARPDIGLDHNHSVLLSSVQRIAHRISHLVAVSPQDPGRVVTLAHFVLSDGLEAGLIRVSGENTGDFSLTVLGLFVDLVASLVVAQNAFGVVEPVFLVSHLFGSGHRNRLLGVLGLVSLNVERKFALFFSFCDLVSANRDQFCGVMDARDLGSKVVLLLAEIEGVCNDFALEVASETDFDLAGSSQVLGIQVRESCPRALHAVGNKVGVFVNTYAPTFTAFRPSVFWQVLSIKELCNKIIFLSSKDFTPETDSSSICLLSQLLERLL